MTAVNRVVDLAKALELDPEELSRHLVLPPAPPAADALVAVHASHAAVLSVCNRFTLFGADGLVFLSARELHGYVADRSRELGIAVVSGRVPHLASVRASDGVVAASDRELEGDESWLAPSLLR